MSRPPDAAPAAPTSLADRPPRWTPRRAFALLLVLGYVALSWVVRFDTRLAPHNASLVYPLDTFSMYAEKARPAVSYLVAEERGGAAGDVSAYRSLDCEPVGAAALRHCADYAIPYREAEALEYVSRHPGRGGAPVDLVRRSWNIRPYAAPDPSSACVVARCAARR